MSIINKSIAIAFGITALCGAANATNITLQAGNLAFTVSSYDSGNLYYQTSLGSICNSTASCTAVASNPLTGALAANAGTDSSWGIFTIESIKNIDTNATVYTDGQGGQYLTGMFGGLQDYSAAVGLDAHGHLSTTIQDIGGWLNVYQNSSPLNPGNATIKGPTYRSGNNYAGITGGTLMLSAAFTSSGELGDTTSTYSSSYNPLNVFGAGEGYLTVTGGVWNSTMQKGAIMDPFTGQFYDMSFNDTYHPTTGSTADGWTVLAAGEADGAAPEPGSIAMIGLGLAALASLRRRKN